MSILLLLGTRGASVTTDVVNTKFTSGIEQVVSTAIEVQTAAGGLLVAMAALKLVSFIYMSFFDDDSGEEFVEGLSLIHISEPTRPY